MRILNGQPDEHWQRQVDLLGKYRKEAQRIRLDDLAQWWWDNMQAEFPRLNQTDNYDEMAPELRHKVLDYYAEDLQLYDATGRLERAEILQSA